MIIEYNRPAKLEQALSLLARPEPLTLPLAGGTAFDRSAPQPVAVIDLQALGLDEVQQQGHALHLGATLTLQHLLNTLEDDGFPVALRAALVKAIRHEATYNLRQVASIAGTLVAANGRSPLATALLALDVQLLVQPGDETIGLGNLLPLRTERLKGRLITRVTLPLNAALAYEYVARTPADLPVVCAAVACWPSGRTRVALGGFSRSPALAFDALTSTTGAKATSVTEPGSTERFSAPPIAARSAYSQAADQWASAEYRSAIASLLVGRCLRNLENE